MSNPQSAAWFYPKPTGDPGRDRNARTVQFACFLLASAAITVAILDVIAGEPEETPLLGFGVAALAAAMIMNRAGNWRWAARTAFSAVLLTAMLLVFEACDGFRSHAMLVFPGVLLLAVMLLDRTSYMITAGTVLVAVAAIGLAERQGLTRAIRGVRSPTTYDSIFLVDLNLLVFAIIGSRIARDTQSNVFDLRASIDRLSKMNLQLSEISEALGESEQQVVSIYNAVRDVIFHLAVEPADQFRFVSVNKSFLKVTGLGREMVVGKPVDAVIPEPSLAVVLGKYRQAIENKNAVVWEEASEYPTGRLTGEVSVVPVFDNTGICTHLVGSVHDVTERKRAEAVLRESEERFRTMADTAPVMIWVTGPDKLFTFVNKTWRDFTGRTLEHELGNGWTASVHPDDLQHWDQVFSAAFGARQAFQLECRLRHADGEYRLILCSGVPRLALGGGFEGYIGSVIDITGLQSEERFRQLAENIDQVFWMFDLGTQRLLYVSPAFEKVWGHSSTAPRLCIKTPTASSRVSTRKTAKV